MFLAPLNYDSHKSLDNNDLTYLEYHRLYEGQKDIWKRDALQEGERIGFKKAKEHIVAAETKTKQAEEKAQQAQDQAKQAQD